MNRASALRELTICLAIGLIAAVAGASGRNASSTGLSPIGLGYLAWAGSHAVWMWRGWIQRPWEFGGVHMRATSIRDLFVKHFVITGVGYFVKVSLAIAVGIIGGGFFRCLMLLRSVF